MKKIDFVVEMDDGTTLKVTTKMADYVLYETTAKRQKPPWGGIGDNPSLWETFVSWAALRRTGQFSSSFEAYQKEVGMVSGEAQDVDPTTTEPGDDSLLS
jgi:hypothetical protein